MINPLLSCFAKTHRLIAEFAAYTQGNDVIHWLDILKDYRIDLSSLAEKGAYSLSFSLIPPKDKDIFKSTVTISIGEYDSITLTVDQYGRLVHIFAFDDAETGLCSLYEDEYFSYSDPDYLAKQSNQQCHHAVNVWFQKQKLIQDDMDIIILD